MRLETFLRLAGLVTLVLGVGLTLFPGPILRYFADGQVPNNVHFVRFLGTALIGFGILNWRGASFVHEPQVVLMAIYANLSSLAVATAIDLIALAHGRLNGRSSLVLLLHLGFGLGFGYYAWQVRATEHAHHTKLHDRK